VFHYSFIFLLLFFLGCAVDQAGLTASFQAHVDITSSLSAKKRPLKPVLQDDIKTVPCRQRRVATCLAAVEV